MKIIKINILWVLVLIQITVIGQNRINSPYTYYGLGELKGRNVNVVTQSMGGISIGYSDSKNINPNNAASYMVHDSTSFIFETALKGQLTTLSSVRQSENSSSVTLSYILMGFRVTKWWASSVGLLPFSEIGYNIDVNIDMSQHNFSDILNNLDGHGRMNQFYWGNAFKVTENLRAGLNINYTFGQGSFQSLIYFKDSANILGTRTTREVNIHDFVYDFGVQYDWHFKKDNMLTIGAIFAPTINANASRNSLGKTLYGGYDNVDFDKDTIFYKPDEKGTIIIPMRAGFGMTFRHKERWMAGFDVEYQDWENFKSFDVSDSITNSWRFSVGGQFTPVHTTLSPLYKKMTYRMGIRYEMSYLTLNGHQLNKFGISIGTEFPIRKSKTTISLSAEYGSTGTVQYGLLRENYINFTLGVSINERWFQKRKYQ
jgi:long-subunit fatty acid transport protein